MGRETGTGEAGATSVLLIRHASAGARHSWPGDDAGRPLDDRGRRQASALVEVLSGLEIARLASSPAARCRATLAPLAAARGLPVEDDDALAEGNAGRATRLVAALLDGGSASPGGPGRAVALCSHGDVIPEVLAALEAAGADLGAHRGCQKGSAWILERRDGGAVAGRYVPPPA